MIETETETKTDSKTETKTETKVLLTNLLVNKHLEQLRLLALLVLRGEHKEGLTAACERVHGKP